MTNTPLLDRIKKLMALADSAQNEHEAALAAERMQALLQEHNLTRAEVEASGEDKDTSPLAAKREKKQQHGGMKLYQRQLMETIAENNFCMYILSTQVVADQDGKRYKWLDGDWRSVRHEKVHTLIGRSENVTMTILMYDHLHNAMFRLNPYPRSTAGSFLWFQGCTETICERLVEQRTGRVQESSDAHQAPGLVRLQDVYTNEAELNVDFKNGLTLGTTTKRRLEKEAKVRTIEAKEAELVSGGMGEDDAWYVARGYTIPDRTPQPITIKARRSRPSYSYSNRSWEAEYRREQRENARKNHPAYRSGRDKGRDIGLGGAVTAGDQKKIGA